MCSILPVQGIRESVLTRRNVVTTLQFMDVAAFNASVCAMRAAVNDSESLVASKVNEAYQTHVQEQKRRAEELRKAMTPSVDDKTKGSECAVTPHDEPEKCPICYCELTDQNLIVMPCGHCLHEECRQVAEQNRATRPPPCPLCNNQCPFYFDEHGTRLPDDKVHDQYVLMLSNSHGENTHSSVGAHGATNTDDIEQQWHAITDMFSRLNDVMGFGLAQANPRFYNSSFGYPYSMVSGEYVDEIQTLLRQPTTPPAQHEHTPLVEPTANHASSTAHQHVQHSVTQEVGHEMPHEERRLNVPLTVAHELPSTTLGLMSQLFGIHSPFEYEVIHNWEGVDGDQDRSNESVDARQPPIHQVHQNTQGTLRASEARESHEARDDGRNRVGAALRTATEVMSCLENDAGSRGRCADHFVVVVPDDVMHASAARVFTEQAASIVQNIRRRMAIEARHALPRRTQSQAPEYTIAVSLLTESELQSNGGVRQYFNAPLRSFVGTHRFHNGQLIVSNNDIAAYTNALWNPRVLGTGMFTAHVCGGAAESTGRDDSSAADPVIHVRADAAVATNTVVEPTSQEQPRQDVENARQTDQSPVVSHSVPLPVMDEDNQQRRYLTRSRLKGEGKQ